MLTNQTFSLGDWESGLAILVQPGLPFNHKALLWPSSTCCAGHWHTRMGSGEEGMQMERAHSLVPGASIYQFSPLGGSLLSCL